MADLVDDLESTVSAATSALLEVVDRDWNVHASGLTWTCRGTVEHVADDLFAYAGQIATSTPEVTTYVSFDIFAERDGEPECAVHAKPDRGNAGVIQILDACGGMGTVEVLLHLYDVAEPLGLAWDPPRDVVGRVLARLFPNEPSDGDPWEILLSATGRDPEKPMDSWRWDGTVREPT